MDYLQLFSVDITQLLALDPATLTLGLVLWRKLSVIEGRQGVHLRALRRFRRRLVRLERARATQRVASPRPAG